MYSLLTVLATKKWIIRSSYSIIYCIFVSWSPVVRLKMKNCTLYTQCVALVYSGYIAPTQIVKIENWKFYVASFSHFHDIRTLKNVRVYVITERVYMCMLLHDTIQVQRCRLDNILYIGAGLTISCILALCVGELCHSIVPLYLLSRFSMIDHIWHNCQATNL